MKAQTATPPEPGSSAEQLFTHVTTDQLTALGVSGSTIKRKLSSGEWKSYEAAPTSRRKRNRLVLVSSLPVELQLKWARQTFLTDSLAQPTTSSAEPERVNAADEQLKRALLRFAADEITAWIKEALRLFQIVARHGGISPKRKRDLATGDYEFVPEVLKLCQEAACNDPVILKREPHRALPPSPYTLDGWWREYRTVGLLVFFRERNHLKGKKIDKRLVDVSPAAAVWMNETWKSFSGPRPFFSALEKLAKARGWKIPSESWVYRQWQKVPLIVKSYYLEGRNAYEAKYAPYVPRDYSDLQPLQVLAGDHSERDVTVSLPGGKIRRPWLTIWYDLLTGLIWGWYLSLAPSSRTAALAYANGVQAFGAQPFARPDEGFYCYILTDRGRDYRSHAWDGKEIAIHREAMRPDGGFELLLVQHKIGILEEFDVKHLLTRGKNPKQNPVERVHRVISDWEQNNLDEYCGRDAKSRPELWYKLYGQHKEFVAGKRDASPFKSFEQYREALAQFIAEYNASQHERLTLGGALITPIEEFRRLYRTRYEISSDTLALILMNPDERKIRKDGVECFRKGWFYYNEAMSQFKGASVEVRFSDDDYGRVYVILPDKRICEAELITPTSLLNPNRRTLEAVSRARAFERGVIKDFNFIAQSNLRGESLDDRVAAQIELAEAATATVHKLTRLDQPVLPARRDENQVTAAEVARAEAETSIFSVTGRAGIAEVEDEYE